MKRHRCIAIVILIAVAVPVLRAQVVLPEKGREGGVREQVFGLGFAGGAATGVGLSFRHHLPGSWSYEITGGIIKVGDKTSYAIGGELQYDLVRAAVSRFFVTGGAGYYYSGRGAGNGMAGPGRIGLGIGGELPLSSGLHVSGELLFTYFTDGTVLPLPQAGVHYYFY
jgi:hypothetical protein